MHASIGRVGEAMCSAENKPDRDATAGESEEIALVRQAMAGDVSAFTELAERIAPLVLGMARRKVGREDAEDLAQEAMLHLWKSLPKIREPQAFFGWLTRLVRNRAHRWIERRQRKTVVLEEARHELLLRAQTRSEADDFTEAGESESREWLESLPDEMRLALTWKYVDGHDYETIGERLSLSFHQVDYLMRRARKALKSRLDAKQTSSSDRSNGGRG